MSLKDDFWQQNKAKISCFVNNYLYLSKAKGGGEIAQKHGCAVHIYSDLGHAAYEEAKDFNRRMFDFLKG